jgi:chorismate mutase
MTPSEFNKRLLVLRKQIDGIDKAIIGALARRMGVSKKIGELKKRARVPIVQKVRWSYLISDRKRLAKRLKLDVKLINSIFKVIQAESVKIQKKVVRK